MISEQVGQHDGLRKSVAAALLGEAVPG